MWSQGQGHAQGHSFVINTICCITLEPLKIETPDKCHVTGYLNAFIVCAKYLTSNFTLTFKFDLEFEKK